MRRPGVSSFPPCLKKPYKIVSGASTPNSRELANWLAKDGQLLIPLDDQGPERRQSPAGSPNDNTQGRIPDFPTTVPHFQRHSSI